MKTFISQNLNFINIKALLLGLITTLFIIVATPGMLSAQIVEYAIVWDVSGSSSQGVNRDPQKAFKALFSELDLLDSDKGVNLYFSTCGQPGIPKVEVIYLEESNWLTTPAKERKRAVAVFMSKAQSKLNELAEMPPTDQLSNIYRSINQVSRQMNPDVDEQHVWVISDLVESSYVVDFNEYGQEPSRLLGEFDKIQATFFEDEPLPTEFKGRQYTLISPGNSELMIFSARFWKRFFENADQGHTVTIRASF